jgi:hypothetical protein
LYPHPIAVSKPRVARRGRALSPSPSRPRNQRKAVADRRRAPDQQRHKHCLLALTWHSSKIGKIPGPPSTSVGGTPWPGGRTSQDALETTLRAHLKLPLNQSLATRHRQHHRKFGPARRSHIQALLPLRSSLFVSRNLKSRQREKSAQEGNPVFSAALTPEMRPFVAICKSLLRAQGQ